jgi:formate/nitrite transporter FocA (FNT family)
VRAAPGDAEARRRASSASVASLIPDRFTEAGPPRQRRSASRMPRVAAPEPQEIYERTREEGRRRLSRPLLELAATALVGGFDVAFGVAAFALASRAVPPRTADLVGAIAFGIGFVFIVVGRSELFTENFLIPVAGLDRRQLGSWLKLAELWVVALVVNIVGGTLLTVILTSQGVLPEGSHHPLVRLAEHIAGYSTLTAFLSALVAGALMTLMTWFVEGAADSTGVRIVMAWMTGTLILLGTFNHAIVSTIELVFGMRYGADVDVSQLLANLGLSVAGNLIGGLLFVTFVRSVQAAERAGH